MILKFKIQNSKFEKSFTLVEILITISILIILAAIGVYSFRNVQPGLQLSGVTRELVTDLRYTQQLTIAEQIEHCLCFFSLDGEYEKKYQIIRCGESDPQCGEQNPTLVKEKLFPQEIKTLTISEFTNNAVEYNPYGAVKESGTITLTNIKDETKIIEVKPSGFVKIK